MIQLQDMYDKVYSHLISSSQHRDTILQVLGQVIIAKGMPDDMDGGPWYLCKLLVSQTYRDNSWTRARPSDANCCRFSSAT